MSTSAPYAGQILTRSRSSVVAVVSAFDGYPCSAKVSASALSREPGGRGSRWLAKIKERHEVIPPCD